MCVCVFVCTHASHSYRNSVSQVLILITIIPGFLLGHPRAHKYQKHHAHAHTCTRLRIYTRVCPSAPPTPPREGLWSRAATHCLQLGRLGREITPSQPWLHSSSLLDTVWDLRMALCPSSLSLFSPQTEPSECSRRDSLLPDTEPLWQSGCKGE